MSGILTQLPQSRTLVLTGFGCHSSQYADGSLPDTVGQHAFNLLLVCSTDPARTKLTRAISSLLVPFTYLIPYQQTDPIQPSPSHPPPPTAHTHHAGECGSLYIRVHSRRDWCDGQRGPGQGGGLPGSEQNGNGWDQMGRYCDGMRLGGIARAISGGLCET